MGTKVKGFFKGLKNISNIFDEGDEEPEIQIGMPTDVKHVAHVGADGPATESPSWMRGFDGKNQSEPMDMTPERRRGTSNHRVTRSEELTRDLSDVPKTTHRHHHHHHRSMDNSSDPDSESSTKPKHARRHHRLRRSKEKGDLPDIPKRSRRKKPNEDDGSTKSTQSKDSDSSSHGPPI